MRRIAFLTVVTVGAVVAALVAIGSPVGAAGGPLTTSPYNGFDPTLTRAPYVTDLTQTTAYVNWATSSAVLGSVKVAAMSGGSCPDGVTSWSSSAVAASNALPGPVPAAPAVPTMTSRQFTVTNGANVVTSEFQSAVRLTGLQPGTSYCYAVFSGNAAGADNLLPSDDPFQRFTTLTAVDPASTSSLTFAVAADTGENFYNTVGATGDVPFAEGFNPNQSSLMRQIGSSGARFLLLPGDISYAGGTQSTYGDLQQTGTDPEVSNIFGPSYFPLTGGIPTFAAAGNHGQNVVTLRNWPTSNTAAASGGAYRFSSYADNGDGAAGTYPDVWYAFSSGNVRIYVLDASWSDAAVGTSTGSLCSNPAVCTAYQTDANRHWSPNSAQYKWLAADLAAHPYGVKFAVFHYPLRSDNATQPSDPYLQNSSANPNAATSLERLLSTNGVSIAFNGHSHNYQRIIPKQSGQIVNYVIGTGGGVLSPILGGTTCQAVQTTADIYAIGWTPSSGTGSKCGTNAPVPQAASEVYSFLKVKVVGDQVTVTPTNAEGDTFDVHTYTVSNRQPPPPGQLATTSGYIATSRQGSAVYVNGLVKEQSGATVSRSPGRTVYLQRLLNGSWQTMLARTTDANGQFAVGFVQPAGTQYRLYVTASATATAAFSAAATSPPVGSPAAAPVTTQASIAATRQGGAVYINGLVKQVSASGTSYVPGRTVYLQRFINGSWQLMLSRPTNGLGRISVGFVQAQPQTYRLFVAPSAAAGAAYSGTAVS